MSHLNAAQLKPGPTARLALLLLPPLNLFAVMARSRLLWPFLAYSAALQRRTGMDPVLRELVILRVAHNENCAYEQQHHLNLARAAGASTQDIDAVSSSPLDAAAFDASTRAALALTDHLTLRIGLQEELVDQAGRQLGHTTVAELVLLAGHYAAIAQLTRCLNVPLDSSADAEAALRAYLRLGHGSPGTWRSRRVRRQRQRRRTVGAS
jgi:4-carboxymuconolactone decarboxylase